MPTLGHGAGHVVIELAAALILVIGGALLVAISFRARAAHHGSPGATIARTGGVPSPSVRRSLTVVLAGLSGGAAAIHAAAAPSHLDELGAIGVGFLAAAAFQGAWALACLGGPSRRMVALGIVANLALIIAWAWTRALGLPLPGPAGAPETIGLADGATVTFEVLLVAGCVARLLGWDATAGNRAGAREVAAIAVVPVLGLVLLLTSLAAVSVGVEPAHGTHNPADHHGSIGVSAARP